VYAAPKLYFADYADYEGWCCLHVAPGLLLFMLLLLLPGG
jgi:hypothetical protein